MTLRTLTIASLLLLCALFTYEQVYTNASQPPLQRTGAPGESTCASGCHGNLNTGGGSVSLSGTTTYEPDSTYTFNVTVTDPTKSKWGFEMTALDAANDPAGNFIILNSTNTNIRTSTVSGKVREYMHHKSANTSTSTWTFDWTAPSSDVGNITFYIAGNAANNSGSNSGDNIYTNTHTLTPIVPVVAGLSVDKSTVCQGTSVMFTSTSTGPVNTYAWDFGAGATPATANTAGPHAVTYSSNGMKTIQLIVTGSSNSDTTIATNLVTVDSSLAVSITGPTEVCPGVNITLDAGTGFISYLWTDGSTNQTLSVLVGGIYHVTVSDGTCNGSDTVLVTEDLTAPMVDFGTDTLKVCPGDMALLDAGAGFQSYLWSTGETTQTIMAPPTADYSVEVSDGGACLGGDAVHVTNHNAPQPILSFHDADNTVHIVNNVDPNATHQWFLDGNLVNGATDSIFSGLTLGTQPTVQVEVTYANGCVRTSDSMVVVVAGIEGMPLSTQMLVSPNPFQDHLVLILPNANTKHVRYVLYNIHGEQVAVANVASNAGNSSALEVSHLPSGMYLLGVQVGTQRMHQKLLKQ